MRDIDKLLDNISELEKAHDKLLRAVPNRKKAASNADAALMEVLKYLNQPQTAAKIDAMFIEARGKNLKDPQSIYEEVKIQREYVIREEMSATHYLKIRPQDIDAMIKLLHDNSRSDNRLPLPSSSKDLAIKLELHHNYIKTLIPRARENKPRKNKKSIKGKISKGIFSAIFGVGMIVANTKIPPMCAISYSLGGAALHQAGRDFIDCASSLGISLPESLQD